MISYYLNEEPILKNIKTYQCSISEDKEYVIKNIDKLEVKRTDGSGGYGMLVGTAASEKEIKKFIARIKKYPDKYIAQPTMY